MYRQKTLQCALAPTRLHTTMIKADITQEKFLLNLKIAVSIVGANN